MDLPLFLYPCYRSFSCSLYHQYSYFRWPTRGTVLLATTLKTVGRTTTKTPIHHPPPLPTLEQVLAMQAQMFQTIQQTMVNLRAQPQAPPPLRDRLGDFQHTKPPTFSHAVEPMDAGDWLKSIEKKLQVL
jgi:hypothetical protein